jgi:hypothetical protein
MICPGKETGISLNPSINPYIEISLVANTYVNNARINNSEISILIGIPMILPI